MQGTEEGKRPGLKGGSGCQKLKCKEEEPSHLAYSVIYDVFAEGAEPRRGRLAELQHGGATESPGEDFTGGTILFNQNENFSPARSFSYLRRYIGGKKAFILERAKRALRPVR